MSSMFWMAWLFVLQGSSAELEFPADKALSQSTYPDLMWSSDAWGGVAEPESYQVQVALDASFNSVVVDDISEITRYVPCDHPLRNNTEYFWRVRCLAGSTTGGWSESRSFTVADFDGYVIELDETTTGPGLQAAFDTAKNNSPATIRLTGDLSIEADADEIVYLYGASDIFFDGAGHSITVSCPSNRLFHLNGCENIIFSDFDVDYNPLPYVLCEVTALDAGQNQLTVTTISNAANPCLELDDPQMLAADRTHMRLLDKDNPGRVAYDSPTYIHDGKQTYVSSYDSNGTRYHVIQLNSRYYTTADFSVGDAMLRVARWDSRNIMRAAASSNICFDNVTAYAGPAQFVSSIDGSGLIVINSGVERKEGRYCSVTADSLYVRRNAIGPWVQDCRFVANGDDCMNFHTVGSYIVSRIDSVTLKMDSNWTMNQFDIGDEVAIWDPDPGINAPVYRTVVGKDDVNDELEFSGSVGAIDLSDSDSARNSVLFNLTRNNRRFMVKDNLVQDNSASGLVLCSQDGAVIGNTFSGVGRCALKLTNIRNEGLGAADVLIRNNFAQGCGYEESFFDIGQGVFTVNSYSFTGAAEVPHQFAANLTFLNNRIDGWESSAIQIHGGTNIVVDSTVITDGGQSGFSGSVSNVVMDINRVSTVAVANTALSDSRGYDQEVLQGNAVTGLSVEAFVYTLPEESSGNLLADGDFSAAVSTWTLTDAVITNEELVINGSGYAKTETVWVRGDTDYTLSGLIRCDAVTSSVQGVRFDLREYRRDGGSATRITSIDWQVGTFGPTRFELPVTTLPDTGKVVVYCSNINLIAGSSVFDDIELIEGDYNLLANGSFDEGLSGGWIYSDAFSWCGNRSRESSSGSLRFSQTNAVAQVAKQYIYDIEPGAAYIVSAGMMIPENLGGTANGAKVVLKFYNGATFLESAASAAYKNAMEWTDVCFSLKAPASADSARVETYVNANSGTVYFDRLKIVHE